jgi:hypothetical protein
MFTAAESDSDVAVLDSVYAKSHGLTAGSAEFAPRSASELVSGG